MRPINRILLPVLAAFLVGGGILLFLWWSLHLSADTWKAKLKSLATRNNAGPVASIISNDPIDTGDHVLLSMRQGDLYALQGRWKEAEASYQDAVRLDATVTGLKKLAQAQLQRRNLDGAKKTLSDLEGAGAKSEDLLLLRVIIALRTGNAKEATTLLSDASASPQKEYGTALLSISQRNHDEAKRALTEVQAGWEPVLREYARVLLGAYQEFDSFPVVEPVYLDTLLSRALAQVQECELALPLLSQVIAQQNNYRDAWIVQGFCELTTERYPQAMSSLERAYQLDPEKADTQYFLGRTYSALGDHKNAMTFVSYAIRNGFQPEKEARLLLADEARTAGDMGAALEQLKILASDAKADKDVTQSYITLAISQGDTQGAYDGATKAAKTWSDDAMFQELLGHTAAAAGKKDEARVAFEKALKLDASRTGAKDGLSKL